MTYIDERPYRKVGPGGRVLRHVGAPFAEWRDAYRGAWAIAIGIATSVVIMALSGAIRLGVHWSTAAAKAAMEWIGPAGLAMIVLLPASGGALAGWVAKRVSPEAATDGFNVAIHRYHYEGAHVPPRTLVGKLLSTLSSLGSGGAGGMVGPSALIGFSMGSLTSRGLAEDLLDREVFALSGIAGAVSTLLMAPIGAALIAVEIPYRSRITYTRFFHATLASVASYLTAAALSEEGIEIVPEFGKAWEVSMADLGWGVVVALLVTGIAVAVIEIAKRCNAFFLARIRSHVASSVAGAGLGGLLLLPLVPLGIEPLGLVISLGGDAAAKVLPTGWTGAAVIALILLATVVTTTSGGSTGMFAPLVASGVGTGFLVGSATGTTLSVLMGTGMAAVLAAGLNVPLAGIVLAVEVFGLQASVPALLGGTLGYLLARPFVLYSDIRA